MKSKLLQVSWHEKQPIWSIDTSPCTGRLLTTGSDGIGRLWSLTIQHTLEYNLQWIADLKGHDGTVNVGRFNPKGNIFRNERGDVHDWIATGSDGGNIVLWEKVTEEESPVGNHKMETEETLERWRIQQVLRKHLQDVLDLQWSCCGRYLVSGSVDNKVIIWDMTHLNATRVMEGHHHFVQGIAVDPLGEYFASQSADRSLRIYQRTKNKSGSFYFPCKKSISKIENNDEKDVFLSQLSKGYLFLDDSHRCMFRRMDWSPDGSFLICPAAQSDIAMEGKDESGNNQQYAAVLFARGHWEAPVFQLLGYDKPAMVVKACPLVFDRTSRTENEMIQLPYNVIFAVATLDTVFLYDIYEPFPIGYVKGMHWQPITDLCWSKDGNYLLVCSIDGYVSVIYFESCELGTVVDISSLIAMHPTTQLVKTENNNEEQLSEITNTRYITQWVIPKPKRIKTK
ncbi:hypothetical protein GpartN1_g7085.t1 [Galdieria partita]|uniref:CAF1B/HIR1 beta-propeller domain-containing protein n=1 Tax=Galdieria partita TaxID=83374 RepID=A0A9C7UTI2_9RHOD|nr:hypothetical protein GpartN1_g7085.t1 [Galdieria partita]